MSRLYTVQFSATITAANTDVDLVAITPTDDKPIRLVGYVVGQTSELGDTAEEGIEIDVIYLPVTVTAGSGGSAPTPAPLDSIDTASGATARTMDTTVATTNGTAITLERCPWNLRGSPLERWWLDPTVRFTVRQAGALVIRWMTTVADDVVVAGTAYFEEI